MMNDLYAGLITTIAVIGLTEILRGFDRRLIAAFTLVGIPFIYIGFSLHHTPSLIYCILAVAVFVAFAYFGYTKKFILIPVGLILHGAWDMLYPSFSSTAPKGYDIFCLTIDVLLAIYFYIRLNRIKPLAVKTKNEP